MECLDNDEEYRCYCQPGWTGLYFGYISVMISLGKGLVLTHFSIKPYVVAQ